MLRLSTSLCPTSIDARTDRLCREYQSYYLNANVAKYMPQLNFTATSGAPPTVPTSTANETIWGNIYDDLPPVGSNSSLAQSFMAINGFAYSTMPTIEVCQDDDVIWHFWSMGSFNDGYHSAHAHGNNFQGNDGSYMAQITLLPASMVTVMMKAANVGLWQMLCHVAAHWQMGMNIQVSPPSSPHS
jgi:FtsP/CotA-like multicopper oxidase with cupredoxin domain